MGKRFGKFLLFAGLAAAGGAAAYYFKKKKDDELEDEYFDYDFDDLGEDDENERAENKRDYVTLDKEPAAAKEGDSFVPLNETAASSVEEEFYNDGGENSL